MTVIIPAVDATDIVAGVTLEIPSAHENVVEIESEATMRCRSTRVVSDDFTFEIIDWRVSLA